MITNPLSIECDVTLEDIVAWNYFYLLKSPQYKTNLKYVRYLGIPMASLALLGTLIFIVESLNWGLKSENILIIFIGVLVGCGALFYCLNFPKMMRRNVRKFVEKAYADRKSGLIGHHTYTFSAEGVHDSNRLAEGTFKWSAIAKIAQDDDHLFIVTRPNVACIIPKRAFPNEAAYNQFAQDVKNLFQAT